MVELGLFGFLFALLALGFKRPFIWVLAFIYVDILVPQKISWLLLAKLPVSLIVFFAAFLGWLLLDNKENTRFAPRQMLLVLLLMWCGYTTIAADYPEAAAAKWSWVWKALVFAIFLPLTLRTRLRIEAAALVMTLSVGAIIISAGIKTAASGGGGYGSLRSFVNDNQGLYEGSTLSMVAIAIIPLIVWLMKHGTVFPPDWRVRVFSVALIFACLLAPVGTQTRTGLLCAGILAVISLRSVQRRVLYAGAMGLAALVAIPFLPDSYTKRMSTIENHEADSSASTRIAVWKWTLEYVGSNPLGGGFDAYLGNKISYQTKSADTAGSTTSVEVKNVQDSARAYHSAYFEMLGEQGWPGFLMWLTLQLTGLVQMELVRRRFRKRTAPDERWQAPLANALQQGQIVYLVGATFVGIAYLPFNFMLVGLQIALSLHARRHDAARLAVRKPAGPRAMRPLAVSGAA